MKKKVLLLITLVVSLFIYSGNVNAIVMWMQCTDDAGTYIDTIVKSDDDFKYNTIAVINEYESSMSTKRVLYTGGSASNDGAGLQTMFFEYLRPTFMVPIGGSNAAGIKYSQNVCWYETDNSIYGGICKEDGVNFVNAEEAFNSGKCPLRISQNTATKDGNKGAIEGDYAVLSGATDAKATVELKGSQFVLYKIGSGDNASNYAWIMEAYNSAGVYGYIVIFSPKYIEEIPKVARESAVDIVNQLILHIPGIRISGISDSDVIRANYDYTSEIDWTQHTQLIRLHKLGKDYFQLSLSKDNPKSEVLLANNSSVELNVNSVEVFDFSNKSKWKIVDNWFSELSKDGVSDAFIEKSNILDKFNEDGEYGNLIKESKKVNDALASGTKYNLDESVPLQDSINNLESAYADLDKLLKDDAIFPYYRRKNGKDVLNRDGGINGGINHCIKDETKKRSSAFDSLVDYVSCSTIGYPFEEITNQSFKSPVSIFEFRDSNKSKKGVVSIGNNSNIVEAVFASVINEQLNMRLNSDSGINLFNYKNDARNNLKLFARYASYLKKYYSEELNSEQLEKLNNIINKYLKLARNNGFEIILDCGTLLGDDFIDRLGKYIDVIKIAIPIILIGFGIFDFAKAIFEQDDEKMRKAKKKFFMRIIIALLFFLLPVFVKLLLSIANKAWNFITPNSCSIEW